jgi:DNA repair protein RecO (recombination protein O)
MTVKVRSHRTEGVVLKYKEWGETDRLLTIFTREFGKVQAIAKGVRKPKSRKAGHLEPFTRVNLLLAQGRDLYILTQAEAIETYPEIKNDLINLGYGSYIIELLNSLTYEEGENKKLYRLLVNTLARLNCGDDPLIVSHYYEIRLLQIAGFQPQLFSCVQCKNKILAEDQFFSARLGGVLCPTCGKRLTEVFSVSQDALKYLRHFQRSSYPDALRAKIKPGIDAEIEKIMMFYITFILEKSLNTPIFIKRMIHERRLYQIKDSMENPNG